MITYPPEKPLRKGLQDYPEFMNDEAFSGWTPSPGKLRSVLQRAEYNLLEDAPIFEGNFVQVTKKGEYIAIHNHPNVITMGILASSPSMLLPDLMIIAREKQGTVAKVPKPKDLEITRLIPLNLVEIFVQDVKERRLKVQMVTGRKYYLQLYAPGDDENFLFERWMRLIYLLYVVQGRITSFTSKESGLHTIWKSASFPTASTKHWLPAIMDKGSTERMQKQLQQIYSSKANHSSTESDLTSRQNLLKSGFAGYASQGSLGILSAAEHGSRQQTHYSSPKVKKKSYGKQHTRAQARHHSHKPESNKQPPPKHISAHSVGVATSQLATATVGVGPSQVLMVPAAVGPSRPASRINTPGVSQIKSIQQFIPLKSPGSEHAPIKLKNSPKSRSVVQTLAAAPTKAEHSETQKKATAAKSQERTAKSGRSSSQRRERSASLSPLLKRSWPTSSPASIRASSTSPAPRSHISMAAGPSNIYGVPVAASPSEAGVVSIAAGPSRPASQGSRLTSERPRSSVAPSERESRGRTSTPHSQATNVKSQEITKSQSSRQKSSLSSSPKRGGSVSPSRSRKEQPAPVPLRRTAESVAVGPSQSSYKTVAVGPSLPGDLLRSRPPSRASGTSKQSDTKPKYQGQKAKSKEKRQPSSAAERQELRSQESDTKNKLKAALSAARQKSSVTFVTIYSVLSSSLDKMRQTRSKDDTKPPILPQNVARKPSKRVTISGVIGPSGKSALQQEGEAVNPLGNTVGLPVTDAGSNTAALKGMETEDHKPPESPLSRSNVTSEGKIPAVGGNISETAGPQKTGSQIKSQKAHVASPEEARKTENVGRPSILRLGNQGVSQKPSVTPRTPEKSRSHVSSFHKSGSNAPQLKISPKSLPNRETPRKAEGDSLPPRTKISVAVGRSAVETVTVAAGPSTPVATDSSIPDNRNNAKEPSMQQSRMKDSQKSSSKPSAVFGPPLESRVSVGVGRSVIGTKSVGVGFSWVDHVSQAAGPSRPASKMGQRSQANSASKAQQFGFREVEANPADKRTSSQKSRTAAASRPASSSPESRDPSDRSGS